MSFILHVLVTFLHFVHGPISVFFFIRTLDRYHSHPLNNNYEKKSNAGCQYCSNLSFIRIQIVIFLVLHVLNIEHYGANCVISGDRYE